MLVTVPLIIYLFSSIPVSEAPISKAFSIDIFSTSFFKNIICYSATDIFSLANNIYKA